MTSHTAGPWVTRDNGKSTWHIDSDRWSCLAKVYVKCNGERHAIGEANARLIAAAPDLLEALDALADSADATAYTANTSLMDTQIAAARAAIAKATGESA